MSDQDPIEHVRILVKHRAADLGKPNPVSWAVYRTQLLGGAGGPLYAFNFTRIDSDMWARVTGELSRYEEWEEGEPEDKDEYTIILRVSAEPDTVEDGFVSIAYWVYELMAWAKALEEERADD